MNKKAYVAFVLHSHLPYVLGHGTWPHGSEWLYEAASETYIPLYRVIKQLLEEGIQAKITIGLTPVLSEQLIDNRFKEGFKAYVNSKIQSAIADEKHFSLAGNALQAKTAKMWIDFYTQVLEIFRELGEDITKGFKYLQDNGAIEIITSGATHGYAPLLSRDESIRAQVKEGKRSYVSIYQKQPHGIWPPELAYRPAYAWKKPFGEEPAYQRKGVEEFYFDEDIKYFLIDAHLLKGGKPIGTYLSLFEGLKVLWERFKEHYKELEKIKRTPYSLYYAVSEHSKKPVAFFTRDPKTALQVWSKDWGYPGDPAYLEFHKKHFPGGHRYWRISDANKDLATKAPYDPDMARIPIETQSSHFVSVLEEAGASAEGENPVIVSPYDAELYGHWWFEGPLWLYNVIKKIHNSPSIETSTLGEYYDKYPPELTINLPEGSWGEGGFHWVWLNEWTEWTWKLIYETEDRFFSLLPYYNKSPLITRILKQFAKELLLLESSDWQFLITTWSARDYAEERVNEHYNYAKTLGEMVDIAMRSGNIDETNSKFLTDLEQRDRLFGNINPEEWKEVKK